MIPIVNVDNEYAPNWRQRVEWGNGVMLRLISRPTSGLYLARLVSRPRPSFSRFQSQRSIRMVSITQEPVASSTAHQGKLASIDLSEYDPEQSKLMDERCIVVDENDVAIGALDKKTCKPVPLDSFTL